MPTVNVAVAMPRADHPADEPGFKARDLGPHAGGELLGDGERVEHRGQPTTTTRPARAKPAAAAWSIRADLGGEAAAAAESIYGAKARVGPPRSGPRAARGTLRGHG